MPKPASSSAVQPPMPSTIMKNRCLYRSTFRRDTLVKKPSRFHRKVMRSSSTRLPSLGALGRISSAGTSRKKPRHTR